MKETSKDKIINQSFQAKLQKARQLKQIKNYQQSLQIYSKVLFLKQDADVLSQIASLYEQIMDLNSALTFYKRANQLKSKIQYKQKIKQLVKIQGMQLLESGNFKNILLDSEFDCFIKRYPIFHQKMLQKIRQKESQQEKTYRQHLYNCLAYLQMNYRQLALDQINNCIQIDQKQIDFIIMKGLIYWSMMQNIKGYNQFWSAYKLNKKNPQVILYLQMINPRVQKLYKDAKYLLIQKKLQKCKINVRLALQMYPYHTQLLILNAYLHRIYQQYQQSLISLQLANKTLQNNNLENDLRNQISLTYNQMGIYLFKQFKYQQAITLFTQGLSFKPNDWGMLSNRGDCYKALQDYIKALEDYKKAYENDYDINISNSNTNISIQENQKKQDLGLRISGIYNARGITLFNSRSFQLACKQFQEAIKFYPKCAQFYLNKAKCCLQLGRKKQAVENLEIAYKYDNKIDQIKMLLEQNKQADIQKGKNGRKVIALNKDKT